MFSILLDCNKIIFSKKDQIKLHFVSLLDIYKISPIKFLNFKEHPNPLLRARLLNELPERSSKNTIFWITNTKAMKIILFIFKACTSKLFITWHWILFSRKQSICLQKSFFTLKSFFIFSVCIIYQRQPKGKYAN